MQQDPAVLVIDADLLGLSRIESAAKRAGYEVMVATSADLSARLADRTVEVVILDLDRGREAALDALDAARAAGTLPPKIIAFVSHVDDALAQKARTRGYETRARGRFWRSLDEFLRS